MGNDNLPKILSFSKQILLPYVTNDIRFVTQNTQDNTSESFVLYELYQFNTAINAHGESVPIVQMNNGYWLHNSFSFVKERKNNKLLKQLSLQFYDQKQKLLFRAEWASSDNPEAGQHAQPHWHLDAKAAIDKRNNKESNTFSPQLFEEYKKQEQDNKLVSVDLGRAHFFMNWDLDKEKDVNAPYLDFRNDEKLFKTWLTDSMKYINSELSSLINKHPKKNC